MITAKDTQNKLNEFLGMGNLGRENQLKQQFTTTMRKLLPLKRYTHNNPHVATPLSAFIQKMYSMKIVDFDPTELEYFFSTFLEGLKPLLLTIEQEMERHTMGFNPLGFEDEDDDWLHHRHSDGWHESYKRKIDFALTFLETKIPAMDIPLDRKHFIAVLDILHHMEKHEPNVHMLLPFMTTIGRRLTISFPLIIQTIEKMIEFLEITLKNLDHYQSLHRAY